MLIAANLPWRGNWPRICRSR